MKTKFQISTFRERVTIVQCTCSDTFFRPSIRQQSLTEQESQTHADLMTATVSLETLADMIETDLSGLAKKFINKERRVSDATRQVFRELYDEVHQSVILAVKSIRDNDQLAASDVIQKKAAIAELAEELVIRKSQRLGYDEADDLETARIELSFIDKLERTYLLARRIAKIVLPAEIIQGT